MAYLDHKLIRVTATLEYRCGKCDRARAIPLGDRYTRDSVRKLSGDVSTGRFKCHCGHKGFIIDR